jgi:predicted nucleic acid-binding protein
MRVILADTSYWIAILNPKDDLHARAISVVRSLGNFKTITTEMILAELMNNFGDKGQALRAAASQFSVSLRQNANAEIIPQTSAQFRSALALYASRPDKRWSLTDCASMMVMQERGIGEALTYDHHFAQAGYSALLRDDPPGAI